jgi:hypothetical protein
MEFSRGQRGEPAVVGQIGVGPAIEQSGDRLDSRRGFEQLQQCRIA